MYWYGGVGTLFYSQNDGDSWEIISSFPSMSNSGYGHNNISAMTTKRGTLYAGTATSQDGIFYTNNLTDWTEYSAGLSSYNLSVSALAVTEEKIYKLGGTVNLFKNDLIGVVGDVNGDGLIDILDIIIIVSMILEGDNDLSADVNNDGQLNILDVVMCIEIILNA
jgi:hypothetical protein